MPRRDVGDGGASALLLDLGGVVIRNAKELVALLIEQQMKIAKVRSAHVPMEVLRLHVQDKHIGK